MNVSQTIACPICGVRIASLRKNVGKQLRCQNCGKQFLAANHPGASTVARQTDSADLRATRRSEHSAQHSGTSPHNDIPSTATEWLTRRLFFVAMIFSGAVALGLAIYIGWDMKANADIAQLKSEVISLSQHADQLNSKGQFRRALDSYELVIAKGRNSTDAEIKDKVDAASNKKVELRIILKDELAKEDAERRRREQEDEAKEAEKRRQDEEHRKVVLAEMEAMKRLDAERRAEEERQMAAIKLYTSPPPAARVALNAIKKLNARTEVGINYRDYGTVVGETWAEVKVFVDSPEGEQLKDFSDLLVSTVDKYRLALEIWKGKFDDSLKYDEPLTDILLQECWRAAGKRLKVAEGLIGGNKSKAHLACAVNFHKIDTEHETEIRSMQIKLIGLGYSPERREAVTKEILDKLASLRVKEPAVN